MDIVDIAKSWIKAANPNEEEKNLADTRMAICNECPNKVTSALFELKCGMCGCPLSKKIYSEFGCPLNKW